MLSLALIAVSGMVRLSFMGGKPSDSPFILFYPAIALTSFLAGVGPGLVAVLAGGVFGALVFPAVPAPGSWIALSVMGPLLVSGFTHLRTVRERNSKTAVECARFRFISDHAADWLFVANQRGAIEYVNQMAASGLGFVTDHILSQRLEDLVPAWQRPALNKMLADCGTRGPITSEIAFERQDGSLVTVEAGCTPVKTGEEIVIHVAARDVTERREMEARLREAQKWESLGVMAGGLAHDFNNLLTSILGNASLAREFLPQSHPVLGRLAEIERASDRSAELVRLMLATSGHRFRNGDTCSVEAVLERTLSGGGMPSNVCIRTEVEAPDFRGDRTSMSTLLGSLIANAAEAYGQAPGEVWVRVRISNAPALEAASFEEGSAGAGPCLGIIVEDQGCGMTKEVLGRAFDPFFSTKFPGRGLGLPAVRGLVRAYAGKLWVKTEPGKGTRVEIWLPQTPN